MLAQAVEKAVARIKELKQDSDRKDTLLKQQVMEIAEQETLWEERREKIITTNGKDAGRNLCRKS